MRKLALLAGPVVARYLWNRRKKGAAGRPGMPAAATTPNLDQPQEQIRAMEAAVDVPGGIRP